MSQPTPPITPKPAKLPHRSPLRDEEKVLELLMKTRSVTLTARLLGIAAPRLSAWLHREKRRAWWLKTKQEWQKELARERQRRYRAKRASRKV
ncbi:MAG: hypothetical protein EBU85_07385 [Actinobacteria bacterium]|nr:hypothetical protein [Actinomycetota bacterium]